MRPPIAEHSLAPASMLADPDDDGPKQSHGHRARAVSARSRFFELARASGAVLTELKADEENLERLFFRVTGQAEKVPAARRYAELSMRFIDSKPARLLMDIDQAHYHGWQGKLQSPWWACLAIVRVALVQVFRNKAYWFVLGLGALRFLAFWSIIYAVTQLAAAAATSAKAA